MNRDQFLAQLELLPDFLGNHILISLSALIIGIVICIPLAILITRVRSLQWITMTFASVMQTIPGIALLALMVPLLGMIGFIPALVALVLYSMLPILRNTVTGILEIEPSLIEAAHGIGLSSHQRLVKIELPLALPVIIAGIRTSTVWVVGTATLSTPVGATSLGNFIFPGLQTQNTSAVLIGSLAAATLAILLDQLIHLIEIAVIKRDRYRGILAGIILIVIFTLSLLPIVANSTSTERPKVVIGAKQFTEQYILAEFLTEHLITKGYSVDKRASLGSSVLFDALKDGTIDCYIDYTGTIWANILKRTENQDADHVMAIVTEELSSQFGIKCLGPLGFENAYALAIRKETSERFNIKSIEQLSYYAPELTIGSDYDFYSRPEWESVRKKYKLSFSHRRQFDPTLMYRAIAENEVDVISAYSTDGRIIDYNLVILKDPKQAFPPYDAVLLLSERAARNQRLTNDLLELLNSIDDNSMRQANRMVDIEKLPLKEASAFLMRSK